MRWQKTNGGRRWLTLLVGLWLLVGCRADRALTTEQASFFQTLADSAQTRFGFAHGAWTDHYGDAPYYGLAFYSREAGDEAHARAQQAAAHNRETLQRAQQDQAFFLENLEEVLMSTLGLMEYMQTTGDRSALDAVDATVETINALVTGLRYYIDLDAGMFAIRTYGPTAITGAVALVNLQYAVHVGGPQTSARVEFAQRLVDEINTRAWDGRRYLVKPGDPLLELYPNTMMMLVLCRLYERTDDAALLERAQAAFDAIQPLRSARGGYRSPYSAAAMGATTDDYSTLSSQNYLMMALGLLAQDTGDARYLDEALFVLEFVRTRLFDPQRGRLLHHFIDGRIALPTDPEFFCAGCNLQTLYVLRLLQSVGHHQTV